MRKNRIVAIILIFTFAFVLASCENKPEPDVELVQYDTPLTFDNYGREITLTAKPQKVLTLGPNCTELFVALGLTDYIIGNSLQDHSRGPLPDYADD